MGKDKKNSDGPAKKDKKAKSDKKAKGKSGGKARNASAAHDPASVRPVVAEVVRTARRKAADLAANPVVAEVVAATLVAAAAALRDPKRARELAESARDELTAAASSGAGQGGAMWKLAMDVARRSVDSLGAGAAEGKKARTKRKSDQ